MWCLELLREVPFPQLNAQAGRYLSPHFDHCRQFTPTRDELVEVPQHCRTGNRLVHGYDQPLKFGTGITRRMLRTRAEGEVNHCASMSVTRGVEGHLTQLRDTAILDKPAFAAPLFSLCYGGCQSRPRPRGPVIETLVNSYPLRIRHMSIL
jgi:hypothetical protein